MSGGGVYWQTCGVCGERVRYRNRDWQHLSRRNDHAVAQVTSHHDPDPEQDGQEPEQPPQGRPRLRLLRLLAR